jgi:hypothetical protein
MIKRNKETHKQAIKKFLEERKFELVEYTNSQGDAHGMTPEIKEFVLNDIENIFNYMHSKL